MPLTIDAVYTFAHALDHFLLENCDQPTVWSRTDNRCNGQKRQLNGSALHEYIADVQFHLPLTGNKVQFNSDGHVEGQFDIWNYQCRNSCGFTEVETWNSAGGSTLNLTDMSTFDFGNYNGSVVHEPPESDCGHCTVLQSKRANFVVFKVFCCIQESIQEGSILSLWEGTTSTCTTL